MIERYLALWVEYMRAWSAADELGYPKSSAGFCNAPGRQVSDATFDEMCDEIDRSAARALDATIDSLPADERAAIYEVQLGVKSRPGLFWSLEEAYRRGVEHLERLLPARGLA